MSLENLKQFNRHFRLTSVQSSAKIIERLCGRAGSRSPRVQSLRGQNLALWGLRTSISGSFCNTRKKRTKFKCHKHVSNAEEPPLGLSFGFAPISSRYLIASLRPETAAQ